MCGADSVGLPDLDVIPRDLLRSYHTLPIFPDSNVRSRAAVAMGVLHGVTGGQLMPPRHPSLGYYPQTLPLVRVLGQLISRHPHLWLAQTQTQRCRRACNPCSPVQAWLHETHSMQLAPVIVAFPCCTRNEEKEGGCEVHMSFAFCRLWQYG